ncbi:unnamed protein product [Rotaria socialis]|uniref:Basement membrane-specific heparan sulfate proteoglycan core protein n=2 Tax=Rotaria socialis TaxID=392032 RepID=A0A821EIJ8_9BILA|nr:unnamed protein product [Rotaria socialis]
MDVLKWSTAVEQADLYAKYLSNSVISNEVSYENYVCNCTNPQTFGKYCEYQFFQGSSSFDDEIRKQYESRWNTSFGSQLHNNRPCYQAYFECNFGLMCLDWRHVCDGKQQCMNGIDEEYCDKIEFNECEDDEYRCTNGMCVPEEYWLDGDYDCMDYSDEVGSLAGYECNMIPTYSCDEHVCLYNHWSCGDGTCLHSRADRINGVRNGNREHCLNFRDVNYMCEASTRFGLSLWTIEDGYCLQYHLHYNQLGLDKSRHKSLCIFHVKCALANSLNLDCDCSTPDKCAELVDDACRDSSLISYPFDRPVLNPYTDMVYNRVRNWRNKRPDGLIYAGSIKCIGYQMTIKWGYSWKFAEMYPLLAHTENEYRICRMFFDEAHSPFAFQNYSGPQYDQFCWNTSRTFNNLPYLVSLRCSIRCISKYRVRDGIADCYPHEEGFNELNSCPRIQRHRLRCSSSESSCLIPAVIGTRNPECSNAHDEYDYKSRVPLLDNVSCRSRNSAECLYLRNYIKISSINTTSLTNYTSEGGSSSTFLTKVPFKSHCDSKLDTASGVDEIPHLCQKWICPKKEYQCKTGQCIPQNWVCDGEWDCSDASDEEGIFIIEKFNDHNSRIMNLTKTKLDCSSRYQKATVPFSKICDISKEYPCFRSDVDDPFNFTTNPPCINLTQIGDGIVNCLTGLDERNILQCGSIGMLGFNFVFDNMFNNVCGEYTVLCTERYPWVPGNSTISYDSVCFYQRQHFKNGSLSQCDSLRDVMCLNDVCIKRARCNGILECENGEDEYRCIQSKLTQVSYRPSKDTQLKTLTWNDYPAFASKMSTELKLTYTTSFETEKLNISTMMKILYPYNKKYTSVYDILRRIYPNTITFEGYYLPFFCNRGLAVKHSDGETKCFCSPAFFGEQCEFYSDRITVATHLDLSNYHAHPQVTAIKVLVTFLYEDQIIDYYEFHVNSALENNDNYVKQGIYFLYPRFGKYSQTKKTNRTGTQLYSVRFEAFDLYFNETIQPIAIWHYPMYFDFLPVYRLSKILRFSSFSASQVESCSNKPCGSHGTCQNILNSNSSLNYFCSCHSGFYGKHCDLYYEECIGYCFANSICKPNYRGILTGNRKGMLCICSAARFGPTCSLKNDQCTVNPCQHGGSCFPTYTPQDILNYTCLCTSSFIGNHCELTRGLVQIKMNLSTNSLLIPMNINALTIAFNNYHPKTFAFLMQHQQVHRNLPLQIQLAYSRKLITAPTIGLLKVYGQNCEREEPKYFVLYFAVGRKDVNITVDLTSENYCPLIEGTDTYNATAIIMSYHDFCRQNKSLPSFICFRDMNYLCMCEPDDYRAECFIYDRIVDRCSLCLANGICLKGELGNKADFECLCPRCYYGELCQYSTEMMSFTLDSLIVKDIQNNRQLSTAIYTSITTILFVFGLFNNYCSLVTFIRPKPRKKVHIIVKIYMAEILSAKCSCCKKPGIAQCDGCANGFCSTHFREHRHYLDTKFAQLLHDRSILPNQLVDHSSKIKQAQLKALLHDINQWEEQAVKSVTQTAERVRNRIKELMTLRTSTVKADLDQISMELRKCKFENNYFEQDIKHLSEKLNQIQIDLNIHKPRVKMAIPPIKLNSQLQISFEKDMRRGKQYFPDGTLLCQEHQNQLNEFYGKRNQMWRLAYKATRDGFASTDFYRCCDRKGATLTVIHSSSGHLFGGYTSINWETHEDWQWSVDKDAFLFTLINPHKILPTKYQINTEGRNAIGCKASMGPTFGFEDICIHSDSNQNTRSTIMFPTDYIDSTGKGRLTFTGSHYFKTVEIEVYVLKQK